MKLSEAMRNAGASLTAGNQIPIYRIIGGGDYPLLISTPIFLKAGEDLDCLFWDLIPDEAKQACSGLTSVVFLCDFLDYLRLARQWDGIRLAGLVQQIEERLEQRG